MAIKKTEALPKLKMPDLVAIFAVSHITIINWKNPKEGVEHRKTPLPSHKDSHGRVTYTATAVKRWADKNEVPMKVDALVYAERLARKQAGKSTTAPKPGPKPAVKKAARKPTAKERLRTAAFKTVGDHVQKKEAARAAPRKRVRNSKPVLSAVVERAQKTSDTAATQGEKKPEARMDRRHVVRQGPSPLGI